MLDAILTVLWGPFGVGFLMGAMCAVVWLEPLIKLPSSKSGVPGLKDDDVHTHRIKCFEDRLLAACEASDSVEAVKVRIELLQEKNDRCRDTIRDIINRRTR